jgi:hypothetical protein
MQTQVHPRKDSIYVDGRSLPKNVESLYFCLNKPKGYMCSNDPNGKKLVVDLFEDFMSAWVRKPRARVSHSRALSHLVLFGCASDYRALLQVVLFG